jgi:hypothetical protein
MTGRRRDIVDADDGTDPGTQLQEEPQSARGAPGSQDAGSDEPADGPVDRLSGRPAEDTGTTVDPQGAQPGAPDPPTGDRPG